MICSNQRSLNNSFTVRNNSNSDQKKNTNDSQHSSLDLEEILGGVGGVDCRVVFGS